MGKINLAPVRVDAALTHEAPDPAPIDWRFIPVLIETLCNLRGLCIST